MSGKVALVTGVGPGNGASFCRVLANAGYQVAMLARDAERLGALESEIAGTHAYPTDVAQRTALQATLAAVARDLGPIEVVIHNAGSAQFSNFLDTLPEALDEQFRINTLALLVIGQAVAPEMLERGGWLRRRHRRHGLIARRRAVCRVCAGQGGATLARAVDGARPRAPGHPRGLRRCGRRDRHAANAELPAGPARHVLPLAGCRRGQRHAPDPTGSLGLDVRTRPAPLRRTLVGRHPVFHAIAPPAAIAVTGEHPLVRTEFPARARSRP